MATRLTVTVLVENSPVEGLANEHGLSVLLVYRRTDGTRTSVLLDFGQSDAFARNADALGIDLADVDCAVLSHAHYDHADGMGAFFARNSRAPLYLSEACAEDCWSTKGGTTEAHYIGIAPGSLTRYASRLRRVSTTRTTTIAPGIHLVPHTTPDLRELGKRAGMLRCAHGTWRPDDFAHEQTLVFELDSQRLMVLNSCSHAGLPVIAAEVQAVFPGWQIAVYVGGLHLVHATDEEILAVTAAVRTFGIEQLYTGHCTGAHALALLQQELPHRIHDLQRRDTPFDAGMPDLQRRDTPFDAGQAR